MKKNSKLKEEDIKYIIHIRLNGEICKPTDREFYGKAYVKQFYGECKNYKKTGIEMYNNFLKKDDKYSIIFADSSELCWDIKKTIEIIKKENMLFLNNVWVSRSIKMV